MNTFGRTVKITFSGESHSDFLSVVIEGLPRELTLDEALIRENLRKRRPKSDLETARIEQDQYLVASGLKDGKTDGSPLIFIVPNHNIRPQDYEKLRYIPRPGHADYPAFVQDPEFFEKSGGGMFSGRLTVLFVIIGSIAQQILREKGIRVVSHIAGIGDVKDSLLDPMHLPQELVNRLEMADFPLVDETKEGAMRAAVSAAKARLDSLGGLIESAVIGLTPGVGNPWFDSVESILSHLLFSIPSVKGVEFGDGFAFASAQGSNVKDEYAFSESGKIVTLANHNGGLLGGLTTGMPLIVRTAIKPTSSIGLPQTSIHLITKAPVTLRVEGRHDPCIALRAVHVVNAVLYYGILDLLLTEEFR